MPFRNSSITRECAGLKLQLSGFESQLFHFKMAYEIFKKKQDRESYFANWNSEQYSQLTAELKEKIYNKYLMKVEVFNRDGYTCQNKDCPFCRNVKEHKALTIHHIKARRNGGKDTSRNGVTLCNSSHQHYERAKGALSFGNSPNLPPHIRGHTFRLSKPQTINWKKVRAEMKILRKQLKEHCGLRLSYEDISILLKFLSIDWAEIA